VTGKKTSASNTSSCCSSSTQQTDIYITFSDFESSSGSTTVSGQVRWFDYYDSRTHCSSTDCASTTDDSEALEGSGVALGFEYDGKTYADEITVDASNPSYSSSWTVELTNGAGESFSFRY
jgi:hypothetical protein